MPTATAPVVFIPQTPVAAIPTMVVPTLTLRDFAAKLLDIRGARPITITTRTIPATIAACPFRNNLCKYAQVNVFVNVDYEASVNRRLEKEGKPATFQASFRRNGLQPIEGTPFLLHAKKAKIYLRCLHPKSQGYQYWTLDNTREYDADEVTPFLRPKGASRQGTENEVMERDYALSYEDNGQRFGIIAATIDGTKYLIVPR